MYRFGKNYTNSWWKLILFDDLCSEFIYIYGNFTNLNKYNRKINLLKKINDVNIIWINYILNDFFVFFTMYNWYNQYINNQLILILLL